tara:strand:+ start:308 stop:1171 length:864 start_codon:yes stop_codon:yes gene_type:complete
MIVIRKIRGKDLYTVKNDGIIIETNLSHADAKKHMIGSGLSAAKVKHMTESAYKKNKDVKNIGNFKLDKALSTSEGKVFVNDIKKEISVSNRGTAGTVKDWVNNIAALTGQYKKTDRYKRAKEIQKNVLKKYPNYKIINLGHSQGAQITKNLNKEGLTNEIINVNPYSLGDKKAKNETTVKSKLDLVSILDKKKKGDVSIMPHTLNPLTEHKPNIISRIDPKTYIGIRDKKKTVPIPYKKPKKAKKNINKDNINKDENVTELDKNDQNKNYNKNDNFKGGSSFFVMD